MTYGHTFLYDVLVRRRLNAYILRLEAPPLYFGI